jgi:hypothetical protein
LAAGNFVAPKLTALGKATIAGALSGSEWDVSGHVGAVKATTMIGSRIALGEGGGLGGPRYDLKSLTLSGDKLNVNTPSFVRSQVYLTGTIGSAKLNLVDTTDEIDSPSSTRRLGVRADVMTLVSFRASGVNSGKLVTLRKLGSPGDLASPLTNPANIASVIDSFRLVVV